MGVHTEYQAVIICDLCGYCETFAWVLQKQAIKEARQFGWSIGRKVKCPKCKGVSNGSK